MNVVQWWDFHHKAYNSNNNETGLITNTAPELEMEILRVEDLVPKATKVLVVGLGTGSCASAISKVVDEVHGLDISKVAIDRCKDFLSCSYTPDTLSSIPSGCFDLAMSYLVSQHMYDDDLFEQIVNVTRSLNDSGVFAIQFASNGGVKYKGRDQQYMGGICREPDEVVDFVEKASAEIVSGPFQRNISEVVTFNTYHIREKRDR